MRAAILHPGLDVHAQTITIAIAEGDGEARLYGTISSDLHSVDKFLAKLTKAHPGAVLNWCYEAGPTGFVLQRHIARKGMKCLVAAPSLIQGRSGDRVKTDKRDAVKLARLVAGVYFRPGMKPRFQPALERAQKARGGQRRRSRRRR